MKYRLEYLSPAGIWETLDMDEAPAMNYQVNDLRELKDRQASYSQKISLPMTANNCRILGDVEIFESAARSPYKPSECRLYCDEACLSGSLALLYVDGVKHNYFECQIVSGDIDLMNRLEAMPMEQPEFNLIFDNTTLEDWGRGVTEWGVPYIHTLATVDKNSFEVTEPFNIVKPSGTATPPVVDRKHIFPAVQFTGAVKKLFEKLGYTLETDVEDNSQNDYIYCGNAVDVNTFTEEFTASGYGRVEARTETGPWPVPLNVQIADPYGLLTQAVYNGRTGVVLTASGAMSVTLNLKSSVTVNVTGGTRPPSDWGLVSATFVTIVKAGAATDYEYVAHHYASAREWTNAPPVIHLADGDKIYVTALLATRYSSPSLYITTMISQPEFVVEPSVGKQVQIGGTINLLAATKFKNPKEFVKAYLQLYSLTMDIDHGTKTVRAYTMNRLYTQIDTGNYVDWSDRLVLDDDIEWSFRINTYGQTNYIRFKDNGNDGDYTDAASFMVEDRTLESQRDLFTIDIEAGRNNDWTPPGEAHTYPTANIPIFSVSVDEGVVSRTFEGSNQHLISPWSFSYEIRSKQAEGVEKTVFLPIAYHPYLQNYVDTYARSITGKMLVDARKLNLRMNLDVTDIEILDFFTPVYIDYFGAYFYISKIPNFIDGELTKVELIRL